MQQYRGPCQDGGSDMRRRSLIAAAAASTVLGTPATMARLAAARAPADGGPLLALWTGPFGGMPPFDRIKVADFKPALLRSMALCRAQIDAIARQPAAPSFDNTIVALERVGAPMNRVVTLF